MRRHPIAYHGVRLRVAPQPYECPYCLHPIGLVGNLLLKMLGREMHGCPRSNVLTAEEVEVERDGDHGSGGVHL